MDDLNQEELRVLKEDIRTYERWVMELSDWLSDTLGEKDCVPTIVRVAAQNELNVCNRHLRECKKRLEVLSKINSQK